MVGWMGVGFAQADQKTNELIAQLEAKAVTINSYTADMTTMTMEMMGQKIVYTGKTAFKKPNKSRTEMNTKIGAMDMQQITIWDGKTSWTYQPNMKMAHKIDLEKIIVETGIDIGKNPGPGDPSNPFQSLNRDSITYVRTEKITENIGYGKDVYIFQGIPQATGTENMPSIPAKIEIGIIADNGMIRKTVKFNEEGKEGMSQSYSNVLLNVNIPDSEFEFTPPEGVQVIDMTENTLNMIKKLSGQTTEPAE